MSEQFAAGEDIVVQHLKGNVPDTIATRSQEKQPYFHSQYEILFVEQGEVEFIIKGKPYRLTSGSLVFISNLENHSISSYSGTYSRYSARFSHEFLRAHLPSHILLSVFNQRPAGFTHHYLCSAEHSELIAGSFKLMADEYNRRASFWQDIAGSELYRILVSVYRAKPGFFPGYAANPGQENIFAIQDYIAANLAAELTLSDIAQRFYINKYHLSHIFKEITGYNFKEYIVLERIARSKNLLIKTSASVQDICAQVGFKNPSHFTRTFKRLEKTSPNRYRQEQNSDQG